MGLWDIDEDIDDFLEDDYVEEENNRYLSNVEEAIKLIAKIIPITKGGYFEKKSMRKIDEMLEVDFLGAFRQIQLKDEAQLQMKLTLLSDKLVEQKKYEILRDKSIVGLGGKFSAGKSKFINSILKAGEELLPEDQNPTTSIPTYIVYGKEEEISAYTSENKKVILDVEALQALTHKFYETYKMGFSSFINSLIISEPDMPYKELVFLDTPGYSKPDTAGKSRNQKEITDENKAYTQLRNVDYLIWLIDIENGIISEPDIAFISKIGIETPILIVVNKSDKKVSEDIRQVVDLVEITAKSAGLNLFGVTAYSSRNNVEWQGANKIAQFLEMAKNRKCSKDDILQQIEEIKSLVSRDIDIKIDNKIMERNALNNVIFRSDDILEINTLVDLYSETMEQIRDMRDCKRKYQLNLKRLEKALDNHYGRR